MTQEDKNLLLQDLCGRLPYNTIIKVIDNRGKGEIRYTTIISCAEIDMFQHDEKMVKPYLRPLSSMTEEEEDEYEIIIRSSLSTHIDWLNKNMFDYRNLISKGLAIEASEGMYK